MGYFSNLAIEYEQYKQAQYQYDVSWTTHEQQLLWRWEDLQELHAELCALGRAYNSSVTYTDDELRYMLPEHPGGYSLRKNGTIRDVERAMDLAAQELRKKYGIDVRLEEVEEAEVDELTDNQLSFLIVLAPSTIRKVA
jgi:hypothetical protein